MTVKLSSKRPDDDLNGLLDLVDELNKTPYEVRIAIVMFKPQRGIDEYEKDMPEKVPVVRFLHIEPLAGEAADTARQMLLAARAKRNGGGDGTLFDVDGPEQVGPVSERIADAWLDDGKAKD